MGKQFLFNIFIACAIASEGLSVLSEKNDQLNILIREKRVIDNNPHAHPVRRIAEVPYIVNILKNGESTCGGSIIAPNIILTAAHCVASSGIYIVLSGSKYRNGGIQHVITRKIIHPLYNKITLENNLSLLTIMPPIDLQRSSNRKIELFRGRFFSILRMQNHASLSGWGCIHLNGTKPDELRLISVPLLSAIECNNEYHGYDHVSHADICTLDRTGERRSCFGDAGGPLVIDSQLLGVMSWTRVVPNRISPDVYVNLALPFYQRWIRSHIQNYGM